MANVAYKFHKNVTEEVRFTLGEYKGTHCLDIRCFVLPLVPGENAKPTRKGLTLRVEQLPELRRGIEELTRALAEGTSTNEHEVKKR